MHPSEAQQLHIPQSSSLTPYSEYNILLHEGFPIVRSPLSPIFLQEFFFKGMSPCWRIKANLHTATISRAKQNRRTSINPPLVPWGYILS